MNDREEILAKIRESYPVLRDLHFASLAVFGSAARGELKPGSDIDLLVEFDRPVGLFHFVRAKIALEKLLGRKVDLVTRKALRPEMRENVLREAIHAA